MLLLQILLMFLIIYLLVSDPHAYEPLVVP
jgi:hypothetical protein